VRRQSVECAGNETGNDRHGSFGNEHAEAMFKTRDFAIATARAFWKNNLNASFLGQLAAQLAKRVRPATFPPHRQCVQNDRGRDAGGSSLKENVAGGDGKGVFPMTRRERGG
jgi:hypothetical protein